MCLAAAVAASETAAKSLDIDAYNSDANLKGVCPNFSKSYA